MAEPSSVSPDASAAEKRRSPRAPILTQIEAQGERLSLAALGRTSNISVGGLLIESPDTLPEGTNAIIRFFLPPGNQPIEAAGRVVRADPGKSMALAFLGLTQKQRQRIIDYIQSVQPLPRESLLLESGEISPRLRRSGRLPRRVAVVLSWQDESGRPQQEPTEIQLVSQHGALVALFSALEPAQLLRLAVIDTGQEVTARAVWVAAAELPGRVKVGLEVLSAGNFWGITFPPDQLTAAEGPCIARRRSARLPRRLGVVLKWQNNDGNLREEFALTRMISKHGAAIRSPVALPVRQPLRLRAPALNREAQSHIVWARQSETPEQAELGVEFLEGGDFWGIDFPPDPGAPLP